LTGVQHGRDPARRRRTVARCLRQRGGTCRSRRLRRPPPTTRDGPFRSLPPGINRAGSAGGGDPEHETTGVASDGFGAV